MNCFFASCEIAENEDLRDKPIAVAHHDPLFRGMVLSASYEARSRGIYTTMIVKDALKLCNELIIVEPNMSLYSEYSKMFFDYLITITPNLEIASVDEGFLDISEVALKIHPLELAGKIQKDLLDKFKLPSSIGIAPNKFLAKMASDMKKPLGITVLRKREIDKYLWPLDISKMYGVGKKTSPRLKEIGINTIGDLANYKDLELLKETVGVVGSISLIERANGIDSSVVTSEANEALSVSNEHTFINTVIDSTIAKQTLKILSNTVSNRLIKTNQLGITIGLKIKYSDFRAVNRSKSITNGTNDSSIIYGIVEDIFDDIFIQGDKIRLVGVFVNRLIENKETIKQYSIFDDLSNLDNDEKIQKVLNSVKKEFGKDSINRGYYEYKEKEE
jgi:DNA polymerase-4